MATYDFSAAFASSFSQVGGEQGDNTLLDLLKLYLGIPLDDTEHDEELTQALNMAGDFIETYLDRVIAKRPVDQYFHSHFGRATLHNMPVDTTATISVFLDGVEQSGYKLFQAPWQLPHLTRQGYQHDMPMDWRNYEQVTVTYTAGYDPIPSDLANAIIWTAADLYKAQGTGNLPGGGSSGEVQSMSLVDVGTIRYSTSSSSSTGMYASAGVIPDTAASVLTKYKRLSA